MHRRGIVWGDGNVVDLAISKPSAILMDDVRFRRR